MNPAYDQALAEMGAAIAMKKIQTFDLIACTPLSRPDWAVVVQKLLQDTYLHIRILQEEFANRWSLD